MLPIPENKIIKKWRLQPGKMFLIDFEQGRIVDDEELKNQFASAMPYRQWIESVRVKLEDTPPLNPNRCRSRRRCSTASRPSATAQEDLKFLMLPHGRQAGQEGDRLDGQRLSAGGAVGPEQAALQLFQAVVRAGHQPVDRSDPRSSW